LYRKKKRKNMLMDPQLTEGQQKTKTIGDKRIGGKAKNHSIISRDTTYD